ncbi:unnamed protein product [Rotaria socialis]|uniref:Protein-tyrosine-phosphatase n=1 Tax=Rotaria socialis TaxID=392032 RepID=A0A818RN97_9BILA|nr:unnamed protein product [Rotaria socialis]
MNRKVLPAVTSMNSASMANFNRMTLLMSISEITPNIFLSGLLVDCVRLTFFLYFEIYFLGQMAATIEHVQKLGISYILNVAVESAPIGYPKNIKLEKFDIIDFPTAPISSYFPSLTDKIHAHLTANKQNKVLVHCMAGISRSATIVCAYLMRYMNMSLREAYLLCKKNRPICFPNLGFWSQLITYENQLRKENSVKMIQTQFGNVPDVAYEEIKQFRAQQQFSSMQSPMSSFSSSSNNSTTSSSAISDAVTNQTRPTARETSVNNPSGLARSRSLAVNPNGRTAMATASTYINNSVYQSPIFTHNKQTFLNPPRFGVNRSHSNGGSHNHGNPSGPSTSSTSFASNRSGNGSPNAKQRPVNHRRHHPTTVTVNTAATTINSEDQRLNFETTYRSSFFKPIVP